MNKKICLYSQPFPRIKSYYDMIDLAADYGLDAVEGYTFMEFEKPDLDMAKKIREYADKKQVTFPCFSVPVKFASENIETLKKYADVAKILGSPYLHHTIVTECRNPSNVLSDKEKFFREGIEAVREIYDYAQSIGVKAIYEEQGYIFNGIEGFDRFIKTVGRDVGVVLDLGNIYQSEDGVLEFLEKFRDLIVHVHIKDVKICDHNENGEGFATLSGKYMVDETVGQGVANVQESLRLLKEYGYDGYYALEIGAEEDDSALMTDSINLIKSWL